jgi:hypothetical protein
VNLEQLKKNVGWRVQLQPPAIYLDARGRELPCRDEDWIIRTVTATEVRLDEATELGLTTALGADIVHRFDTNRSRTLAAGPQYGFLVLGQQMTIQQDKITYRPCPRPGERVPPLPVPIVERRVELNYPVVSHIQPKLEASGYLVNWVGASRLPALEFDGWELVIESDRYGMPTSFYVQTNPENLVLVKKRRQ